MRYFKHSDSPTATRFKVVLGFLVLLLAALLLVIVAYHMGKDNRLAPASPSSTQSIDCGGCLVDVHRVEVSGQSYLIWMTTDRMCVTPLPK